MEHIRSALALPSVAFTLTVLAAGAPYASADPYDGDHTGKVMSPGFHQAPADDGSGWDQADFAGPDVADPGDWDLGGAGADKEPPRSATETLTAVAIGCGVLALGSLVFFVVKGRGRREDDDR